MRLIVKNIKTTKNIAKKLHKFNIQKQKLTII